MGKERQRDRQVDLYSCVDAHVFLLRSTVSQLGGFVFAGAGSHEVTDLLPLSLWRVHTRAMMMHLKPFQTMQKLYTHTIVISCLCVYIYIYMC